VKGVPLLGNALGLARDPVQYWVDCAREYGPAFRVDYPTAPKGGFTVLAGREANRLATARGHELFTTRQYYARLTRETGTENYVAALDGERHKHFRAMIKPALSREALVPFVPRIFAHVEALARSWRKDQRVPVMAALQRVTVDALSMAAAGVAMTDDEYAALATYARTFVGSGVAGRPAVLFRRPAYKRAIPTGTMNKKVFFLWKFSHMIIEKIKWCG
jgi:cytochrome P450